MSSLSQSEQKYLITIDLLTKDNKKVNTTAIAAHLEVKAASVTEMAQRLAKKKLLDYRKYHGLRLTNQGQVALDQIKRRQLLWELFLERELSYATQGKPETLDTLSGIEDQRLINQLEAFLGYPEKGFHGQSFPAKEKEKVIQLLSNSPIHAFGRIVQLESSTSSLSQFFQKHQITIGSYIKVLDRLDFDQSVEIEIDRMHTLMISKEIAKHIHIES